MARKKFYAVRRGLTPGIYTEWFGAGGAHEQVRGVRGAVFRGFATREEAQAFMNGASREDRPRSEPEMAFGDQLQAVVYTDGGAIGNPGPGGYGVVILRPQEAPLELSGGFRRTTNNRMELMACIVALDHLDGTLPIVLYSDSRYMVDAINKRWVYGWASRGWKKADGQAAKNPDLWQRLLKHLETRSVTFRWVKGHAGQEWNERCDRLAASAMSRPNLPPDPPYEASLRDRG